MAADPRHVREALRRTETQLQKLVEPMEGQLHDAARALAATEDRLRATHVALVKQLAFWRDLLYECEHAVDEDGGQPDCSALYRRCAMIEGQIDRLRRLQTELEQTTAQYDKAAAEVRRAIHDDVPAAIHWLHDRDTALARFDDSGSIGALVAAAGGSQAEKLVTLGRAALASGNPVLLTIFAAAFDGMGTHGAKYNAARQSFLRSLAPFSVARGPAEKPISFHLEREWWSPPEGEDGTVWQRDQTTIWNADSQPSTFYAVVVNEG